MKQKRQSSYNKLKLENESLNKEIYNLICNADKEEGFHTRIKYEIIYKTGDAAMFGDIIKLFDKKPGITGLINNSEKTIFRR